MGDFQLNNLAYQTQPKRKKIQKTKVKRQPQIQSEIPVTPGEKLIMFAIATLFAIGCIFVVSKQAMIFQANKEVQVLQQKIEKQQSINSGLEGQISELRNPDRILRIAAEQGLTINENNIKMIQR